MHDPGDRWLLFPAGQTGMETKLIQNTIIKYYLPSQPDIIIILQLNIVKRSQVNAPGNKQVARLACRLNALGSVYFAW